MRNEKLPLLRPGPTWNVGGRSLWHAGPKRRTTLAGWADLRAHVQEQVEKMHAKIEAQRGEHDVKVAERRAERAEAYAMDADGIRLRRRR